MSGKGVVFVFRALVFGGILALSLQASADVLVGRVVAIADGDTLTVLDGENTEFRVRVGGIDAPERNQPFGQRARQYLAAITFGKEVEVRWTKRDRWRRIVGLVWVEAPDAPCRGKPACPKSLDAGLAQVQIGLAWWYRKYAAEQSAADQDHYEQAESQAKAKRAGLWAEKDPIPPWEWRRR